MKVELLALRAKIRGFELESAKIRRRIEKFSGNRRWAEWNSKRLLGEYTRVHLVAYGLLRNIPYEQIEKNSSTSPNADGVLDVIHAHVSRWERSKWTKERVEKLLDRESKGTQPQEKQEKTVPLGLLARVIEAIS